MILLIQLQKSLVYSLLILFFAFAPKFVFGQELNCNVKINYEQVNVSADVFEKMELAITEFINSQRWTNDVFKPEERINCNIFININSANGTSSFESTMSIQASRPIYGTSYESSFFNFFDKNVGFTYQEDQPLYFVENAFTSNLTSVLAFYSYVILGHDYDTFSKMGGTRLYDKANETNSYAQQSPYPKGWNVDDKNSRNEMIQDLTNTQFASYRNGLYLYHKTSMDNFQKNPGAVRANILKILEDQNKIFDVKQNSMLLRIFYMSKSIELVNIFSKANSVDKAKFLKLVGRLDPSNLTKYEKINKTN